MIRKGHAVSDRSHPTRPSTQFEQLLNDLNINQATIDSSLNTGIRHSSGLGGKSFNSNPFTKRSFSRIHQDR